MNESTMEFEQFAEQAVEASKGLTEISTAENSSQIQGTVLELNQTNVVKYENRIESSLVSNENLKRIVDLCQKTEKNSFSGAELCLGIATLFAGAAISAILAGITFEMGWRTIAFYTVSPAIAIGCFVAYFFMRKNESLSKNELAKRILEYLPINEEEDR